MTCPNHSPYSGPKLPSVAYTVNVTVWLTPGGPKVKPQPVDVSQGQPGLCIDDGGNLNIYHTDADEVDISFRLDPAVGTWYPDPTQAFEVSSKQALVGDPTFANGLLVVDIKAKGYGYNYNYTASYVDNSGHTLQTEPGIQNH